MSIKKSQQISFQEYNLQKNLEMITRIATPLTSAKIEVIVGQQSYANLSLLSLCIDSINYVLIRQNIVVYTPIISLNLLRKLSLKSLRNQHNRSLIKQDHCIQQYQD
ncbi:hypothetical protein TTHERM_000540039 (macronuclear) [Tetrahymena thermophila SB210]|uniref:Uncharacterized protein n=1 Tax=Tetrahymena thermophila (strain SB210) TaxID=312017 RepID=W7XF49_TETTS|nr:hypothetical protein TTHERM_000540039 [Tetrahymena thermophila SB210]EWS76427.1 hypothetical protein TTHERM_000540039 [Tetrahymena thermophila SB210]|eukprot:XP_012651051.1 hypothetical protein TTHERM_000540039 [Tetrahymena thermophila SB210]